MRGMGNDEREQTLNQLLTELDGFDGESLVICLAATNRADMLDSALKRPGRFDRTVSVERPDKQGRMEILGVHIGARRLPLKPGFEVDDIATMTAGFGGRGAREFGQRGGAARGAQGSERSWREGVRGRRLTHRRRHREEALAAHRGGRPPHAVHAGHEAGHAGAAPAPSGRSSTDAHARTRPMGAIGRRSRVHVHPARRGGPQADVLGRAPRTPGDTSWPVRRSACPWRSRSLDRGAGRHPARHGSHARPSPSTG